MYLYLQVKRAQWIYAFKWFCLVMLLLWMSIKIWTVDIVGALEMLWCIRFTFVFHFTWSFLGICVYLLTFVDFCLLVSLHLVYVAVTLHYYISFVLCNECRAYVYLVYLRSSSTLSEHKCFHVSNERHHGEQIDIVVATCYQITLLL